MQRRTYLTTLGTLTTAAAAGCLDSTAPATTTREPTESADPATSSRRSTTTSTVPDIALSSQDVAPSDPDYQLHVEYNWTATGVLDPGEGAPTRAEDSHKWVLVHARVHNEDGEARTSTARQYTLTAEDDVYEYVAITDHALEGQDLPAGERVGGWVVFHVPLDLREAVLSVEQRHVSDTLAVAFTADRDLRAEFPES